MAILSPSLVRSNVRLCFIFYMRYWFCLLSRRYPDYGVKNKEIGWLDFRTPALSEAGKPCGKGHCTTSCEAM